MLEGTAKEIRDLTGNPIFPVSADIRDPAVINSALDTIEKELGLPTVVVNNAGNNKTLVVHLYFSIMWNDITKLLFTAAGNFISPTERVSPNAWKTIVDIVLNGTANVTLGIGKRLIAAQKGKNQSSHLFSFHSLNYFFSLME